MPMIGNYKKNEIPVINYEGPNDVFVWKHSQEDFYTGAQLIVHESQEAIFFRNGQALDLFPAGRYVLETENLPLLNRLLKKPLDGQTPFHAEIYYVNKVTSMDILWGTAQPVMVEDPIYGIILPVRANGQFAVRVTDSRKLLVKLVGTIHQFNKETLVQYFRGLLMTHIRASIAQKMVNDQMSFLEIQAETPKISDSLRDTMAPEFAEYGLELVNFFTNAISIPEDNPDFIAIKKAKTDAQRRVIDAQSKRTEMDLMGYTYQQKRTFDVLDKAAANQGTGSEIMNATMGLGMGLGVGGMMNGAMNGAMQNAMGVNMMQQGGPSAMQQAGMMYGQQPQQPLQAAPESAAPQTCAKCGAVLAEGAKFCPECGEKVVVLKEGHVICPECGQQVPKAKFCLNCGHPLVNKCPECGEELPDGAKFCMNCGHRM